MLIFFYYIFYKPYLNIYLSYCKKSTKPIAYYINCIIFYFQLAQKNNICYNKYNGYLIIEKRKLSRYICSTPSVESSIKKCNWKSFTPKKENLFMIRIRPPIATCSSSGTNCAVAIANTSIFFCSK